MLLPLTEAMSPRTRDTGVCAWVAPPVLKTQRPRSNAIHRCGKFILVVLIGGNRATRARNESGYSYMGGTRPSLPTATLAAVRLPSGWRVAVTITCAPGFSMER